MISLQDSVKEPVEIFCCVWRWPNERQKYYIGIALSDEGRCLRVIRSATLEGLREELGAKQGFIGSHDIYGKFYHDYQVTWLDNVFKNDRFLAALSRNHCRPDAEMKFRTTYRKPIKQITSKADSMRKLKRSDFETRKLGAKNAKQ